MLGVSMVADQVAQKVVRLQIEADIGPYFPDDTYCYRLGRKRRWIQ
jgi:hypothetical protein